MAAAGFPKTKIRMATTTPKDELPSRDDLLRSTLDLCQRFADAKHSDIREILSCFSSSRPDDEIRLIDHGLPKRTPYLGRSFVGREGIQNYFETIVATHLSYENMVFSDCIIDVDTRVTSLRGKAFEGKAWEEVFLFRIQLDEEGKIVVYEVWADSGAAYLATHSPDI